MPRIYTSASDPLDFCKRCFPGEATATLRYACLGDGPDGRGNCFDWDINHPGYEDTDYTFHTCKRRLGEKDNYK
jgi:hypothetical protein